LTLNNNYSFNETYDAIFRPGLTLRQNNHVIRASRGKGAPQKSGLMAIYFYQPDIRLKNTPKIKKM
jgi:hypothetical protein